MRAPRRPGRKTIRRTLHAPLKIGEQRASPTHALLVSKYGDGNTLRGQRAEHHCWRPDACVPALFSKLHCRRQQSA